MFLGKKKPAEDQNGTLNPRRVYVANLDYDVSTKAFIYIMGKFGPMKDTYLPLKVGGKQSKGYGFVEFERECDAKQAIKELDGSVGPGGRVLIASIANPRQDFQPER